MWQLVLVHSMLCKVSLLARNSCCSSGCTFPKWGNVLQEQIILQCHFKWGCFASFHSTKSKQLCPSFCSFDVCQMLLLLCIFSSDHCVQLIKKCELSMLSEAFSSEKQSLWWRPNKNKFSDFQPHIGERVERSLFPKPLTPFIEMLETFCQIPGRKDHSGLTTAGFSGAETLCRGTDCVTMRN